MLSGLQAGHAGAEAAPEVPRGARRLRVALALYAVVQVAHIIWQTRHFGVRGDELITLQWSTLPVEGVIRVTGEDIHPPLYYLVLHVALSPPVDPIVAGKLLSLVMTLALLRLVPVVAAEFGFARRVGEAGLVLTAMSPLLWQHGVTIRPYPMAAVLYVVCVVAALRVAATGSARARCALAGALVLIVYVNYLAALCALITVNLLYLSRRDRVVSGRNWMATQLAAVPFLLPLVPLALNQTRDAAGIATSTGIASSGLAGAAARFVYWFYGVVTGETLAQPFLLALLCGVLVLLVAHGVVGRSRMPAEARRALLACAAVALVAPVTYAVVASLVFRGELFTAGPARTLFAVPFVALALAQSLTSQMRVERPGKAAALAVALSVCWIAAGANEVLGRDYFHGTDSVPRAAIARLVREKAGTDGQVLVDAPFGNDIVHMLAREGISARMVSRDSSDAYRAQAEAVLARMPARLVLVRYNRDLTGGSSTWFLGRLSGAYPAFVPLASYAPTSGLVRWIDARAGRNDPSHQVTVYLGSKRAPAPAP
ncbi:hypothetical protein GCM10022226_17820 [Sphaerisporangium flaviroseum]|uniref:Glycosyltransferase RgtA/B/C/D-like domain-containing protein n=1 Tax=Sphaerisporangium flaviroseum TaxID=509199 RepID=A0ABP7HNF4_9ACTN